MQSEDQEIPPVNYRYIFNYGTAGLNAELGKLVIYKSKIMYEVIVFGFSIHRYWDADVSS